MKILIVDPDMKELKMLVSLITNWGHEALKAVDCKEALNLIRRRRFDLLLLEISLPGCCGYDMIQEIKDRFWDTKIVVMTGNNSRELETKARASGGIQYYMIKPFEFEDLRTIIDHIERQGKIKKTSGK
jgi:DNA-binding response OmpR family regulator